MALNFPSTPTLNQVYTSGEFSWIWNGYAWDIKPQNLPSPSSNTGLYISSDGSNYIFAAAATSSNTVVVDTVTANTSVTINAASQITSSSYTTGASTSEVTVDEFATSSFRSAKYLAQMTAGSNYHTIELLALHDNTTVYLTQYGEIYTSNSLGTFDASITTGTLSLKFTPASATVTTIKLIRKTLSV